MKDTVRELEGIVSLYAKAFDRISEEEFSKKPLPNKWSKKEVLGHLIDSAQNNLRRFIAGQYENNPKIFYEQDFWVQAEGYQQAPAKDVILFWKLINEKICRVLSAMDPANYSRKADTGKQSVNLLTLEFLAEDYVKHMKHHINQIIPGSYDIIYT
ncbi:MAG TPA: DinB family protein [Cyclobacteriaceae bacterium]|nr:DinB family protein [Cyclobacteriaceae bacterium]